ncbi:TetR/AcrR family transcriptional regulator [Caulobacter sp. LARHSG274]
MRDKSTLGRSPPPVPAQEELAKAAKPARPRIGRPTVARSEVIQQALLDAARELFLTVGFDATPMETVAAEAGVSKSTLYARYPTKEALMKAVVDDRISIWASQAGLVVSPMPQDFKDRLRHIARVILTSITSEEIQDFNRILLNNVDSAKDLARALFEAGHQLAVARLAVEIQAGTHDFPAPPRSALRVAEMMMAMLTGWHESHRHMRRVTPQEAAIYADHVVDVLFAARTAW